ncbi:hypothetical protein [Sphingomonas sp. CLY1604]|uniref:hypothetical protein n=1 Tax=Sphingomonas sp. CLY1604 TaxID=3457786 RepID=UPI003FD6CAE9
MSSFMDGTIPIPITPAGPEDVDPPARTAPHGGHRPKAPREIVEDRLTVELRRRRDGWTAERQRIFLNTLANTGRVTEAAEMADITPRSAYRLRNHPQGAAFARAWDAAIMRASGRLLSVAMERAISGTPQVIWREGRIVAETATPSDRMLMFLLRHLNPALFDPSATAGGRAHRLALRAQGFAPAMAAITDTDVEADLLDIDDYRHQPPSEQAP